MRAKRISLSSQLRDFLSRRAPTREWDTGYAVSRESLLLELEKVFSLDYVVSEFLRSRHSDPCSKDSQLLFRSGELGAYGLRKTGLLYGPHNIQKYMAALRFLKGVAPLDQVILERMSKKGLPYRVSMWKANYQYFTSMYTGPPHYHGRMAGRIPKALRDLHYFQECFLKRAEQEASLEGQVQDGVDGGNAGGQEEKGGES